MKEKFIDNKYCRWYFNIIENRKNNAPEDSYTEKHHILPRCLGGDNSSSNLIRLTSREHFICHALLVKMVKTESNAYFKLLNAAIIMGSDIKGNRYINSKLYDIFKKKWSLVQKSKMTDNNHRSGKTWVVNFTNKENKSISKNDLQEYIRNGWKKGRVIDFSLYTNDGERIPYIDPNRTDDAKYNNLKIVAYRKSHGLTNSIPNYLLKANFINSMEDSLKKLGFDFLADNIEDEYIRVSKIFDSNKTYSQLRTIYGFKSDRTITLLKRFFSIKKNP